MTLDLPKATAMFALIALLGFALGYSLGELGVAASNAILAMR